MNLTEKIGWGIGSIASGTALISWIFGSLDFNIRLLVGLAGIIILAITAITHRRNQNREEDTAIISEKSSFPIIHEKRQDYHNHVVGLFKTVTDNLNPLLMDDKDYFTALRKTKTDKWRVFQHFKTIDLVSEKYSNLFAMYEMLVMNLNELEERKKSALKDVIDFDRKLEEYISENKYKDYELDFNALRSTIGIKHDNTLDSILKGLPEYSFPSSISCNFYLVEKDNGFQLGVAGNWFARSKNKDQLKQLKDFIYEQGSKIMEEVSSIHSYHGTLYAVGVPIFNQQFKKFNESLDGEPVLGACLSCLGWFNSENEKKYKPVLEKFNSVLYNDEESVWRKGNTN